MSATLFVILSVCALSAAACIALPLLRHPADHDADRRPDARVVTGGIALFVIAVSFFAYLWLGQAELLPQIEERRQEISQMRDEVAALQRRLTKQPDELKLWVQLGLIQLQLENYTQTVDAFRRAVLLSDGNAGLLLLYAKALMFQAGGSITSEAQDAFSMVLLQDPGNVEAQFFLAMREEQQGDREEARRRMEALADTVSEEHPLRPMVERVLDDFKQ